MQPNNDSTPSNQLTQAIPTPSPTGTLQPIVSVQAWGFSRGGRSIFAIKKVNIFVYPGVLIGTDTETGQEFTRIALNQSMKVRNMLGCVAFTMVNGQKISAFARQYVFYFYDPRLILISYIFMLLATSKSTAMKNAVLQAATSQQV